MPHCCHKQVAGLSTICLHLVHSTFVPCGCQWQRQAIGSLASSHKEAAAEWAAGGRHGENLPEIFIQAAWETDSRIYSSSSFLNSYMFDLILLAIHKDLQEQATGEEKASSVPLGPAGSHLSVAPPTWSQTHDIDVLRIHRMSRHPSQSRHQQPKSTALDPTFAGRAKEGGGRRSRHVKHFKLNK